MSDITDRSLTGPPCACGSTCCRGAPARTGPWWREMSTWSTVFGLVLFLSAVASGLLGAPTAGLFLYLCSLTIAGLPVGAGAVRSLLALRLDMKVLMVLAVTGAVFLGEWFEAALVVLLFSLSESLERYNLDRSRRSIRQLMDLTPPTASVCSAEGETRLPVAAVELGSVILVRPGERIPLDGRIISGTSYVNQAPITGESVPVSRTAGNEVFAGTINGDGLLEVRVTRGHTETTLARIIHLVERAEAGRAPAQKMVDRFAAYYTPVVVILAAALAVLGPAVWGGPRGDWLYRSMALLLIACPCALVISTPVSVLSALSRAARAGVLVKGGIHLETAGRISTVLFDKTGTLTRGRPRVAGIIAAAEEPGRVLELAARAEFGSEHPLARAVVDEARAKGIDTGPPDSFQAVPGRGVRAQVDGSTVLVGSREWVSGQVGAGAVPVDQRDVAAAVEGQYPGHTFILVARDGRLVGALALADEPRPEARRAVDTLRRLGVSRLGMLTGDNDGAASLVAVATGLDHRLAGLLPEDKVEAVTRAPRPVAMVGDGINDAPALAAADLGIALGAAGTDAALETADVALMSDDLTRIPFLVELSRATRTIIAQNVALAVGLKAMALLAAASGYFTLWMAVLADTGAALLVVSNGMRLLRHRGIEAE